jgi:hypothetical protein
MWDYNALIYPTKYQHLINKLSATSPTTQTRRCGLARQAGSRQEGSSSASRISAAILDFYESIPKVSVAKLCLGTFWNFCSL